MHTDFGFFSFNQLRLMFERNLHETVLYINADKLISECVQNTIQKYKQEIRR